MAEAQPVIPEAVPAATVLLLRDHVEDGLQVLMVRRNTKLAFAGGMWVFPGGRVDAGDWAVGDAPDGFAAARRAAAREVAEEAGLEIGSDALVAFSHWTPPATVPKRFATWFFAVAAPGGAVTVDGGEIKAHQWTAPLAALRRFKHHDIELIPPTWITLAQLSAFSDTADVLSTAAAQQPMVFVTKFAIGAEGAFALYEGDAGYADGDPDRPGPRHRLFMGQGGWCYTGPSGTVVAP